MSKQARVFVIDDDSSARNGLARLLRTAGHEVHAFESANEFLEYLDPGMSGCIVLDARMPGLSGEELHSELKSRAILLPLIFVTADDDPETKRRAMEAHASAFFRKPVDGTALLDAIAWAMESDVGART
jgi:FixJ family two-component response regulator